VVTAEGGGAVTLGTPPSFSELAGSGVSGPGTVEIDGPLPDPPADPNEAAPDAEVDPAAPDLDPKLPGGSSWVSTGLDGVTTVSLWAMDGGSETLAGRWAPFAESWTSCGSDTLARVNDPWAADTMPSVKRMAPTPGSAHHGTFIGRTTC